LTRINVVPPSQLSVKHLVAEYREITRLPGNLKKSLERKTKPFSSLEIPPEYVLGSGHVKFFYDKMFFLQKRFESLVEEMLTRGYNPKFTDSSIFKVDTRFYNDYTPTNTALELNRARIAERS
jgi:deoxyribonuclease (pyrimidine dimer)